MGCMRNFDLKMTENDNLRNVVKLEIQSLLCTEKAAIPSNRLYGLCSFHSVFVALL